MNAVPTTTVSILRGTSEDVYGDPTDTDTTIVEGLPASILEQSKRTFNPSSDRASMVRYIAGRLPNGTDVRTSDRLKDDRTGIIYRIDSLDCPQGTVRPNDITLELVRVSANQP